MTVGGFLLMFTVFQKSDTPTHIEQFSTDFQNSFTGTLCRKFNIKLSFKIPPHLKRVTTLPYETIWQI